MSKVSLIKNSRGIALIPIIVVVGVLALIGVAGFAVYQAGQDGSQLSRRGDSLVDDDGDLHIGNNSAIAGDITLSETLSAIGTLSQQEHVALNNINLERVGGDSRYLTAIEVSKSRFARGSNDVVLVNGESYADAVTAIGLSYTRPILYVPPDVGFENDTFKAVGDELRRLGAKKLTFIGGNAAISQKQSNDLSDYSGINTITNVTRLAGSTRIGSSIATAASVDFPRGNSIFLANGYEEADSALFQRGYEEGPLVFVNQDGSIPVETLEFIRERSDRMNKVVLLGSSSAITEASATQLRTEFGQDKVLRIAGENRYHTATALSSTRYQADCNCNVYIVNSVAEADAIMANALSAGTLGPVLYVETDNVPLQTAYEIQRLKPKKVVIVGGTARVNEDTAQLLRGIAANVIDLDSL